MVLIPGVFLRTRTSVKLSRRIEAKLPRSREVRFSLEPVSLEPLVVSQFLDCLGPRFVRLPQVNPVKLECWLDVGNTQLQGVVPYLSLTLCVCVCVYVCSLPEMSEWLGREIWLYIKCPGGRQVTLRSPWSVMIQGFSSKESKASLPSISLSQVTSFYSIHFLLFSKPLVAPFCQNGRFCW